MLTPKEIIAKFTEEISVQKFRESILNLAVLGFLAGCFISFGGLLSLLIGHDSVNVFGYGVSKVLMGIAFSLALVLVMTAGAELFTCNTLMVTGLLSKQGNIKQILLRWFVVFVANFVNAMFVVVLYYFSKLWLTHDAQIAKFAINIAETKVNLDFEVVFVRGIFANWLVCLAVWLGVAAKDIQGKILGIMLPVTTFVALSFEHSIANMFYIPLGIVLKNTEVAAGINSNLENLTWNGFITNLLPATMGNILGGAIFVGAIYWFVYYRNNSSLK